MMDGYGYQWFGMGLGGIMMLLFWGGLIALGVLVIWSLARNSQTHSGTRTSDHALDLLRERYARGEITKDEYERIRQDLNG